MEKKDQFSEKLLDNLLSMNLKFKLNPHEVKVWKIAIMYIMFERQYFPDYRPYKIPNGDPRKCILFRYCRKLLEETKDKLKDKDYRYYIKAQFHILKNIQKEDGTHGFVVPASICGERAWNRWLVWKSKMERAYKVSNPKELGIGQDPNRIIFLLQDTKKFLVSKLGEINKVKLKESIDNRAMFRWVALGQVTGYFLALSLDEEWLKSNDLLENFNIDLKVYKQGISQPVIDYYNSEFPR